MMKKQTWAWEKSLSRPGKILAKGRPGMKVNQVPGVALALAATASGMTLCNSTWCGMRVVCVAVCHCFEGFSGRSPSSLPSSSLAFLLLPLLLPCCCFYMGRFVIGACVASGNNSGAVNKAIQRFASSLPPFCIFCTDVGTSRGADCSCFPAPALALVAMGTTSGGSSMVFLTERGITSDGWNGNIIQTPSRVPERKIYGMGSNDRLGIKPLCTTITSQGGLTDCLVSARPGPLVSTSSLLVVLLSISPPFAAIHAPDTHGANPSPHPFSGSPVTVDRGILPVRDENSYMSALLWCRNLGKHLRWERLGAARPGFAPRALGVCCTEQPVTAVAGGRGGVPGWVLGVPRQITARRPATSAGQPCWTTRCAPRARAGCGRPR